MVTRCPSCDRLPCGCPYWVWDWERAVRKVIEVYVWSVMFQKYVRLGDR